MILEAHESSAAEISSKMKHTTKRNWRKMCNKKNLCRQNCDTLLLLQHDILEINCASRICNYTQRVPISRQSTQEILSSEHTKFIGIHLPASALVWKPPLQSDLVYAPFTREMWDARLKARAIHSYMFQDQQQSSATYLYNNYDACYINQGLADEDVNVGNNAGRFHFGSLGS